METTTIKTKNCAKNDNDDNKEELVERSTNIHTKMWFKLSKIRKKKIRKKETHQKISHELKSERLWSNRLRN